MSSSLVFDLIKFVGNALPKEFIEKEVSQVFESQRERIFNGALVIWLMIYQRLSKEHTLAKAVGELKLGNFNELLKRGLKSKRVKNGEISASTGGYSKARKYLPLSVVESSADKVNEMILESHEDRVWEGRKVHLIDGSTFTLPHTDDLIESYPPCTNQYGQSHWPKMRTCFVHDLVTGVALRPAYGPMYSEKAVGEIQLLREMMDIIPGNSVLVGDSGFGIFTVAYQAVELGHDVTIRLTNDRARKFLKTIKKPGKYEVEWIPSKHEKRKYPELADDAKVKGRFIWYQLKRKGYKPKTLYIFTTLELPLEKVVELYTLRWNIETDIRQIKSCMDFDHITGKTKDMVEKEIILANTAYNLVRHLIAMATKPAGIDPRRISFSRFKSFIEGLARNMAWYSPEQREQKINMIFRDINQFKNPKRKRKAEPRKVLVKRRDFPIMKKTREEERKDIDNAYKIVK